MKSAKLALFPLALVASLSALGCVAGADDASENLALEDEGDLGTAQEALTEGTPYYLKNVNSGKMVDIFNGVTTNGAPLVQLSLGANISTFTLAQVSVVSNIFYIMSSRSNSCLDLYGGNTGPGANIVQWSCGENPNQRFTIESVGPGTYRIRAASGLCLTTYADSSASGYAIVQDTCVTGKTSQQFNFISP